MIGRSLLHYKIVDKLGRGGMGVVYKALDTRLDRYVAIKLLPPDQFPLESQRRRFVREAKAASALNHPNIITIYEIASADGMDLIVMEYVRGETLSNLIPSTGMAAAQALRYAIQLTEALAKAHAAGIIHRDLKPHNMMVTEDSLVKILDFGLAKWNRLAGAGPEAEATLSAALTEEGAVLGTVVYMSPEQARGETVDARSDIFSCGVVLYEMLTGARPFTGSNALATVQSILVGEPPPLRQRRPDVPEAVERALAQALEKDRERRYQTMAEFGAALRAATTELGAPEGRAFESATTQSVARPRPMGRPAVGKKLPGKVAPWLRPRYVVAALAALLLVAAVTQFSWLQQQVANWGLFSSSPFGSEAQPQTAYEWYQQGQAYLYRYDRTGNVDRAVEAYQNALKLDANFAPAYAGLAEAYLFKYTRVPDSQWVKQAEDSALQAVKLNEDLAAAHVSLARVHIAKGEFKEADASLNRALQLDPLNPSAFRARGRLYLQQQKYPEAQQAYKKALELDPKDWDASINLGTIHYRQARYDEAARTWEQTKAITPDNIYVLRSLAAAYHMLDRHDEAAAELQRALEIEPSALVYNNLGTLRFFQGRYAESAAAFEKAVELEPNRYLYWGNLGDAYRWAPGKRDQARPAYQRAIQLLREDIAKKPGDPDLRSTLALHLAKSGDKPGALAEMAMVEKAPAKTPGIFYRAAVVYELTGNRQRALDALSRALEAGYSLREVRNEPELVSLRADVRYHRLEVRTATAASGKPR